MALLHSIQNLFLCTGKLKHTQIIFFFYKLWIIQYTMFMTFFYKHNLKIVFMLVCNFSSLFQGAGYYFVKYGSTIFHLAIFFLGEHFNFFNFVIYSMGSSILIDILQD